jgi:hypothetical protein
VSVPVRLVDVETAREGVVTDVFVLIWPLTSRGNEADVFPIPTKPVLRETKKEFIVVISLVPGPELTTNPSAVWSHPIPIYGFRFVLQLHEINPVRPPLATMFRE